MPTGSTAWAHSGAKIRHNHIIAPCLPLLPLRTVRRMPCPCPAVISHASSLADTVMEHLSTDLAGFCQRLPKVELHAHLNGSCRDSTLKELAEAAPQMSESCAKLLSVNGAADLLSDIIREDFVASICHRGPELCKLEPCAALTLPRMQATGHWQNAFNFLTSYTTSRRPMRLSHASPPRCGAAQGVSACPCHKGPSLPAAVQPSRGQCSADVRRHGPRQRHVR